MTNVIKFEDLPVEALTEVAKESFEEAVWATEKALAKQLEFGRVMLIVKAKLPHGEWGSWVRETFADHLSLRTIQTHMKAYDAIAQNPALLECANSLDDILTLTAKPRKPTVEVIEVAADVPVADEIVTEDKPAVEVITAVPPVKPVAAKPASSPPPPELEVSPPPPEPEAKRPMPVHEIKLALMRMKASAKRRVEIIEVATLAWDAMNIEQKREFFSFAADKRQSLINRERWY